MSLGERRVEPLLLNPSYIRVSDGSAGPIANATRWTYTVPSNRCFRAESLLAFITRVAAAAPAGIVQAYMVVSARYLAIAQSQSNNIQALDGDRKTGAVYFSAGESIIATSGDTSTGGTTFLYIAMYGVEFDIA